MFHTPKDKRDVDIDVVQTRSTLHRIKMEATARTQLQRDYNSDIVATTKGHKLPTPERPMTEIGRGNASNVAASSSKMSSSSLEAKKKMVEYEAALAVAELENQRIQTQKELIQKKAAADIAVLEVEASQRGSQCSSKRSSQDKVQQWLEQSQADDVKEQPQSGLQLMAAASAAAPSNDIALLAQALEQLSRSTTRTNTQLLSRLATPKDLPLYFGDTLDWLQFKKIYTESNKICDYSDAENITRLSKCLRGEAKETVSALLTSDASANIIMEALELRFGRPEMIISKISTQIKKIPPLPQAYHAEIVNFSIKVKNFVAAAKSINQSDFLRSPELLTSVVSKCPTVLVTKWTDYAYLNQDNSKAKLEIFADFLHIEATRTAAVGMSLLNYNHADNRRRPEERRSKEQHHTVLIQAKSEEGDLCTFCRSKNPHKIIDCLRFKRALRKDRWRFILSKRLCHKCLISHHHKSECSAPTCGIDGCIIPHHPLLHWPAKNNEKISEKDSAKNPENESVNSVTNISETVAHTSTSAGKVLLKVVKIKLHGPLNDVDTYALLDDGATVSLISAEIANLAGIHGQKQSIRIRGAWNSGELKCESEIVDLSVSNSESNKFKLKARKVAELDLPMQTLSSVKLSSFQHLLPMKNYLCCDDVKPQILIGQDNYHLIVPKQTIIRDNNEPCATLTPLGWCAHGIVPTITCRPVYVSALTYPCAPAVIDQDCDTLSVLFLTEAQTHQQNDDKYLHEMVRQSFAFEAIGVHNSPRKNPDDELARQIVDQSACYKNGKWEVGLPWRPELTEMNDSFANAQRRLKTIEKKLANDTDFALRYKERVNYLFKNEYARPIKDNENATSRLWYLPHFAVDNPNKGKLRLVFDAASKSNGKSLNDYLLQGPDLLQPLLGIMFRFREGPIGISGDIKDMFLRVKIREEDQHALRFLWREDPSQPIRHHVMTSLIFGANCSPFVAQHIKNKNALRFETLKPDAVRAILFNHYMDDYIDSYDDVSTAVQTMSDVTDIHAQGNFEIRNWSSNKSEVCANAPDGTLSNAAVRLNIGEESERTLGLLWFPSSDTLGFDLSLKRIPNKIITCEVIPTKREVLKIVMSIFDVYGLLAPYTMQAKILLQSIWKTSTGWDEQIPQEHFTIFKNWILQINKIRDIKIPRWYFAQENSARSTSARIELHVLCDASPAGFACVAYWRRVVDHKTILVSFIASKSRVAPIKHVSVARMELQGAVLACRLAATIKKEHRIKCDRTYYWTDSQIVLHWIRNTTRAYKVFVANRLGEIDELSSTTDWYYVPTDINIADVATKYNKYELSNDCEWFTGPRFLHQSPLPCQREIPEKDKNTISEEQLETVHTIYTPANYLPVPDATRFSSWSRIRRSTAYVILFIDLCRKKTSARQLNTDLMTKAEELLLRAAQLESFPVELNLLKQNKYTQKESKLRTLTPYLDGRGLMRVGGRIGAAVGVDPQLKQPVILHGCHPLARLIVKHHHIRAAHGHNEMVVNELRQRYWVLRLRPTVRAIASSCLFCRIRKTMPKPPLMGDLPAARLSHHQRCFTFCGVDLFGPVEITVGRRRAPRYGVLFTCLTVRAIHIEIVSSLSADSFIMAFRRMAARRGWPSFMYSDNGTNFHGANNELKKAFLEKEVLDELTNRNVTWNFLSPASPHMGGAWERQIRTVKTALKVVLNERAPREETLTTLLAEVENIVNSKPLTHVSVHSEDDEALTPNHFLLGGSSNVPVPGVFDDSDIYLRKQWRIAQRLTDMFWSRWVKEVLPTLIPRQKWYTDEKPLKVGDIVLIADPNAPRNTWIKGRIQKVLPGKDGRIRIVDVKTKTGSLRRPTTKIVVLPTAEECHERDTEGEDVKDAA